MASAAAARPDSSSGSTHRRFMIPGAGGGSDEGGGGGGIGRGGGSSFRQVWSTMPSSESSSSGVGEEETSLAHHPPSHRRRRRIVQNCQSGRMQACVEVRQSRARWPRFCDTPGPASSALLRRGSVLTAAAPGSPTVILDGVDGVDGGGGGARRFDSRARSDRVTSDSDDGDILIKIRSPLVSGLGMVSPGGAATADSIIGIRLRNFDRRRSKRGRSFSDVVDNAWVAARGMVSRAGMRTVDAMGKCGWMMAKGSKSTVELAKDRLDCLNLQSYRTGVHWLTLMAIISAFFPLIWEGFLGDLFFSATCSFESVAEESLELAAWAQEYTDWRFAASVLGCLCALAAADVFSSPQRCHDVQLHAAITLQKERTRMAFLEREDERARRARDRVREPPALQPMGTPGVAAECVPPLKKAHYRKRRAERAATLPATLLEASARGDGDDDGDIDAVAAYLHSSTFHRSGTPPPSPPVAVSRRSRHSCPESRLRPCSSPPSQNMPVLAEAAAFAASKFEIASRHRRRHFEDTSHSRQSELSF